MDAADVLAGLVILVGLIGIVVPVLPGTVLIFVTLIVWAAEVGGTIAWTAATLACVALVVGTVVKYFIPGRQLKATVPTSTLVSGGLLAVIGFFVVPVVGALVGFPIGVYVAEWRRVGGDRAWPSTKAALKAIGVSILLEFVAGLVATSLFIAGALAT